MTSVADFRALAEQMATHFTVSLIDPFVVIACVTRHFGVSLEDIQGASRTRYVSLARRTTAHLLRSVSGMTLEGIGYLLRRDHTTVIYQLSKAAEDLEREAWRNAVDVMAAEIRDEAERRETNGQ